MNTSDNKEVAVKDVEQNPLLSIRNKNEEAIAQMNEVLSQTLGHKLGRMVTTGVGVFAEYVLYAVALGVFLFIFMMYKVSPFYILPQMKENKAIQDALNPHMIANFTMVIRVIIGAVAFFIFTTALALRRSRRTRSRLQDAIITLRDVHDDLKTNSIKLQELDEVSDKMLAAATVVANEA